MARPVVGEQRLIVVVRTHVRIILAEPGGPGTHTGRLGLATGGTPSETPRRFFSARIFVRANFFSRRLNFFHQRSLVSVTTFRGVPPGVGDNAPAPRPVLQNPWAGRRLARLSVPPTARDRT